MKVHGNAALGPAGRLALVEAIESGMTLRAAAAALNVAPATAHRWWHRWRGANESERRLGRWLEDRSSRPHRQPRRLSRAEEEPILRARRETNLGPARLAGICRRARSTIWKGPPPRSRVRDKNRKGAIRSFAGEALLQRAAQQ
jgi:leucine-zipper of insertion element IS481